MLQKEDDRKRAEHAETARLKAEEEARRKQEEDFRRTEAARRRQEEEQRLAAEARRKAEEEVRNQAVVFAEAKRKAEQATAACLAEEAKAEQRITPKALEDSLQHEVRLQIQDMLKRRGHLDSAPDGKFGTPTRNAIVAFQRALNVKPTGYLTPCQLQALWTDTSDTSQSPIARTR